MSGEQRGAVTKNGSGATDIRCAHFGRQVYTFVTLHGQFILRSICYLMVNVVETYYQFAFDLPHLLARLPLPYV